MPYTPLTEEQYNKALASGFTHDQIIEHEKTRKTQEDSPQSPQSSFQAAENVAKKSIPQMLLGPAGMLLDRENYPALGGMAGSLLGGPAGGIGGAAAGSMLKQGIGQLKGEDQISPTGVATDTALQGVLPEAIGSLSGIFKSLKTQGLRQTVADLLPTSIGKRLPGTRAAETINQAKGMLRPESAMVETAASNAQANLSPSQLSQAKGTVAEDLSQIPYTQSQIQATPPLGKTADKIFSDVLEVRNAKLATGNPTIVRQLAQDRILRKNWNFENGSFNPSNVLSELGKSEDVYKEAMGPAAFSTFKELMQTAKELKVGEHPESLISWHEARKVGALSLFAGILGAPYHVTAPLVLSVDAMRKIAADPQIGQLIIAGMKTPHISPAAGLLSKAIANSLRGTIVYLQTKDGQKEKAQFDEQGNLQPVVP